MRGPGGLGAPEGAPRHPAVSALPPDTPDGPLDDAGAEYKVQTQRQLRARGRVPQTSPTTRPQRVASLPPPTPAASCMPRSLTSLRRALQEWTVPPATLPRPQPRGPATESGRPCPGAFLALSFCHLAKQRGLPAGASPLRRLRRPGLKRTQPPRPRDTCAAVRPCGRPALSAASCAGWVWRQDPGSPSALCVTLPPQAHTVSPEEEQVMAGVLISC